MRYIAFLLIGWTFACSSLLRPLSRPEPVEPVEYPRLIEYDWTTVAELPPLLPGNGNVE